MTTSTAWTAKDTLTTSLSGIALAVSLISAYFTVLRVSEDVRMVVTRFPQITIESPDSISVSNEFQLAFINSGNRPAVIIRASLFVDQGSSEGGQCDILRGTHFLLKGDPLVVKAAESGNLTLTIDQVDGDKSTAKKTGSVWTIPIKKKEEFLEIQMCVSVDIATPTSAYETVYTKIIQQSGRREKGLTLIDDSESYKRPAILVRRTMTVWTD